jgi:ankyrin repeat protein
MDIVQLMIEKGACNWDLGLEWACQGGHLPIVELMIENGASRYNEGLIWACKYGYIDIVKMMIEKGAYILETNTDYTTIINKFLNQCKETLQISKQVKKS